MTLVLTPPRHSSCETFDTLDVDRAASLLLPTDIQQLPVICCGELLSGGTNAFKMDTFTRTHRPTTLYKGRRRQSIWKLLPQTCTNQCFLSTAAPLNVEVGYLNGWTVRERRVLDNIEGKAAAIQFTAEY